MIRAVRLKAAAALISSGATVVDLACGAGFLRNHLPRSCKYYGVDRIQPPDPARFDGFLHAELTAPDFFEKLAKWLPEKADIVTLLAFVEHVTNPEIILRQVKSVLKQEGRVVLTTPHPIGRNLHDSLARLYLCSRAGAAEHERFLDESDLRSIGKRAGYQVVRYKRFLCGLNQLMELRPEGN